MKYYKAWPVLIMLSVLSINAQNDIYSQKKLSLYFGLENRLPQVFPKSIIRNDDITPALSFDLQYQLDPHFSIGYRQNIAYRFTGEVVSIETTRLKRNYRIIKDYFLFIDYTWLRKQYTSHHLGILGGYMYLGYRYYDNHYLEKDLKAYDFSYPAVGIQYVYQYKRFSAMIGFYYGEGRHSEVFESVNNSIEFDWFANRSGHIFFTFKYLFFSF